MSAWERQGLPALISLLREWLQGQQGGGARKSAGARRTLGCRAKESSFVCFRFKVPFLTLHLPSRLFAPRRRAGWHP